MSASAEKTARVYETTPARLLSLVEGQQAAPPAASSVADDLADGVEAIHQLANLAGYGERVRAFVLALATAAHARGGASVCLFDDELAELQNCSAKTVQRQRADYLNEARRLRTVDLVGIEEGEFDRDNNRHAPTRYTFHISGTVERVVADARSDPRWHDLDRKGQRELLKQAAARAYDLIPDAVRRPRKRKRPRLASAVVDTHRKAAETHLRKLRATASLLPAADRERLFDDPGELREWWLSVRAEMDELCGVNSPDSVSRKDLEGGGGQFVHHPPPAAEDPAEAEPGAEAAAGWERTFAGLAPRPAIRTVEVPLRPPEYPPGGSARDPAEEPEPVTVEEMEAEAVRAEACGGRVAWGEETAGPARSRRR